ncbi:MAG: RecB family exonuclease [Oligosphaeraceae bacterium]
MFDKPLVNDLTWSVSRSRLFRSCPRAYYYQYYGAWGGWSHQAPPRARLLYQLKQMTSFPLWGGDVVHKLIKETLLAFRETRETPVLSQLQEQARAALNRGWKESRNGEWKQNPKGKTNLFEHYYAEEGESVSQEKIQDLRSKVFDAMEGFLSCGVLDALAPLPPEQWKSVDALDTFVAGELPPAGDAPAMPLKVWCALDLAYQDSQGILHVLDWKTGAEHRDELRLQLSCYALYARKTWDVPLERISLEGVFLNDAGRTSRYEISPETLEHAQEQILKSAGAMRAKLQDPVQNAAQEEDFPCASDTRQCRWCPFRKVCPLFQEPGEPLF